ncbi:nuclear transport factor 2 family protein (plasmid) [Streptomyces sp. NBC_00876]|uniref:nuclear transport factor 2 family protein n=1 Tax=Streptomyces sp. NBC_00876 TaxID=2975853 RepID=UPI002F91B690|nr:nuclear transport factor 2 family protein [Streptomyces sp. NBC_00876]
MATEEHGFTLPGADLPAPDADLRARREAVVAAHTIAETVWDIPGVMDTFPRGAVYRIQAFEESPFVGEDAIRKGYFDGMQEAFPNLEHELHHVHHTPTAVILEAQARGKQEADWRGIPNKGKSIDAPVAVFFHFDGDVLIDETLYFDVATFQRQLG